MQHNAGMIVAMICPVAMPAQTAISRCLVMENGVLSHSIGMPVPGDEMGTE